MCEAEGGKEEEDELGPFADEEAGAGIGSRTEGSNGNEIEVDQAPSPRAAEVRVPEAFVRCKPPRTGLKMAPTSGTLLTREVRLVDELRKPRGKPRQARPAPDSLDAETDRDTAGGKEVHKVYRLCA